MKHMLFCRRCIISFFWFSFSTSKRVRYNISPIFAPDGRDILGLCLPWHCLLSSGWHAGSSCRLCYRCLSVPV